MYKDLEQPIPKFESDRIKRKEDEIPCPFEYNLLKIYPNSNVENTGILTDYLYFYVPKYHKLVKKYVVLTKTAFFLYLDEKSYQSAPIKPIAVLPLFEVSRFCKSEYNADLMLKNKNLAGHGLDVNRDRKVYVMSLALKRSYRTIIRLIWNYKYQDI